MSDFPGSPEFINFQDNSFWSLETIYNIVSKVKDYADRQKLVDVRLVSVEDNSWSDPDNQRFDVYIEHSEPFPNFGNQRFRRKLLILKGEVLDGKEFHKRCSEFYPEKS